MKSASSSIDSRDTMSAEENNFVECKDDDFLLAKFYVYIYTAITEISMRCRLMFSVKLLIAIP